MKTSVKIISLLLIVIVFSPQISVADERISLYGVRITLKNNRILNGYFLSNMVLSSCSKTEDHIDKWNSYLIDNIDDETVTFIEKLVKIETAEEPNIFAAESSVKKIKKDDMKSIEGVCRKWSDTDLSYSLNVPSISDSMFEYISNHKMVAYYYFTDTFAGDPGYYTTYIISFNTEYPRKRLIKQRKIIKKMSKDELNKEKLLRIKWADV